jgi:hypothetical protein
MAPECAMSILHLSQAAFITNNFAAVTFTYIANLKERLVIEKFPKAFPHENISAIS